MSILLIKAAFPLLGLLVGLVFVNSVPVNVEREMPPEVLLEEAVPDHRHDEDIDAVVPEEVPADPVSADEPPAGE